MTEDERAARGWPSTSRVPLCRRSGAVRGAVGAQGGNPASCGVEAPTPVSEPLRGTEAGWGVATFPGAKAEDEA